MSFASVICFLIALAICLSCFRKDADIFSPGRIFGLVWSVAIGLADLKFSRLQHEWEPFAWFTILLGVGSFLIGVMFVDVLTMNRPHLTLSGVRMRIRQEKIDSGKLFWFVVLLAGLYGVSFLFEWVHYGVLPLFAKYPDRARGEIAVFGVHLIVNSMPTILFLTTLFLFLVPDQREKKAILIVLAFLTAASSFFLLNRLFYVLFVIMAIGTGFYATRFVRTRNILVVGLILSGILGLLQSFREAKYVEHFFYVVSDMKYSATFASLTGPYMYVVMNLENFARAVVRLDHFSYGLFSFDFFWALTGLKHWIGSYAGLQERLFLVSGYNTFPFFWDFYYDFGLTGLVVLSGLFGAGAAYLHHRMKEEPTVQRVVMYSIMLFSIIISFFTNIFAILNFEFNVALIFLSQVLISPRRGRTHERHA